MSKFQFFWQQLLIPAHKLQTKLVSLCSDHEGHWHSVTYHTHIKNTVTVLNRCGLIPPKYNLTLVALLYKEVWELCSHFLTESMWKGRQRRVPGEGQRVGLLCALTSAWLASSSITTKSETIYESTHFIFFWKLPVGFESHWPAQAPLAHILPGDLAGVCLCTSQHPVILIQARGIWEEGTTTETN